MLGRVDGRFGHGDNSAPRVLWGRVKPGSGGRGIVVVVYGLFVVDGTVAYSMVFFDVEKHGSYDKVYGAFCEEGGTWVGGIVEDGLHRFCLWHLGETFVIIIFK